MLETAIIVCDFGYIEGGASQVALTGAVALARKGVRVVLFCAVGPVMPALEVPGLTVVCTGQRDIARDARRVRAATQGVWNLKAQRMFARLLDTLDRRRTVVHLHTWTKALSSSVVAAARARDFPVVCTLHDYFTACPNGGFYDYQRKEICTEIPLSAGCLVKHCDSRSYPQKVWRVARQLAQGSFGGLPGRITHFITVSDFSAKVLKPFLPAAAKLYRVPNPIEAQKGTAADPEGSSSFLYVGRLTQEKGVLLLAEAAGKLGIAPVFVGAGECAERIRELCPQSVLTGWLSRDGVRERLLSARALVLPSLWYETQGLVVAEAAAFGVPAVVPDRCAASEMVRDGVNGAIFKSGDCDDLARQMARILEPGAALRLGREAYRRYWAAPFTMQRHLDDLMETYKKVVAAQAGAGADPAGAPGDQGRGV